MVASLDGAATRSGRSGALGGEADRLVFHALRELPDAIVAGAATVRAERYRPPRPRPDGVTPRLVIASASLNLPADLPCLADESAKQRPLVLTTETSPPSARAALSDRAEILVLEGEQLDPRAALAALADRGIGVVLCEGGPRLLGRFVAADVVDEWFLTIAAVAVLGGAGRIAAFHEEVERRYMLRSVLHHGDDLMLAYERAESSEGIRTT